MTESLKRSLDRRHEEILQVYYDAINRYSDNLNSIVMSERMVEFILETHDLDFYLDYFKINSLSHDAPYHNKYHTYCMVAHCYEGSRFMGICDRRALLLAALYHDANHSAGKMTDEENIKRALRLLEEAHKQADRHGQAVDEDEYLDSIDAIKITKYPYEGDPETMIQKIIRDADRMQVYESDPFKLADQFLGLKQEVELARNRTYTSEEWAKGIYDFESKIVWHTSWALEKARVLNHERARELLKDILLKG